MTDGITTRYTYDGDDILFETQNGSAGNVYIHGPGIDEPLALLDSKGPAYYHADGLGSIVALSDSTGTIVQRYEYDSFGNRKDMQNTIKQPYTYTGREYDRETGLYYYRARYYDAMEGRFISKDPIGFAGGNVNLYGYVWNEPINYVDPTGLFGAGQNVGGPGESLGHSDFSGAHRFDYNKEDTGWTAPWIQTNRHFRNTFEVEGYLKAAIRRCDKESFERYMHQGQDVFSHYDQGYEGAFNSKGYWGHALAYFTGDAPDDDPVAWQKAEDWTKRMLYIWEKNCGCK